VVIASKGGEPTHPDWYHNLLAHPEATVEVGGETFPVRTEVAQGAERRRLFDQQAAQMPFFAEYERTTPRIIPVVILTRSDSSPGQDLQRIRNSSSTTDPPGGRTG